MKADTMFAELGYIKIADDGKPIIYQKQRDKEPYKIIKTLTFYTRDNDISIETYLEDVHVPLTNTLSVTELQAIRAKIKEMGWV